MNDKVQAPIFRFAMGANGGRKTLGLAYQIEAVPGISDIESQLIAGIRLAADSDAFSSVPEDEKNSNIMALSDTFMRSRYHKLRFDECKIHLLNRRELVGGPVVGDLHATPATLFEAKAFLGAARTVLDILVYLAARRSGEPESKAKNWSVSKCMAPEDNDAKKEKYDIPEIELLRRNAIWFKELNVYRNVVFHRGLRNNDMYGYCLPDDMTEETTNPDFNSFILPDINSLAGNRRPHRWTYNDRHRIDDLVESINCGLESIMHEVLVEMWGGTIPRPSTAPREVHPNTILMLPRPVALTDGRKVITPVFDSVEAAHAYELYGENRKELYVREIFPTLLDSGDRAFLLRVPNSSGGLTNEVQVFCVKDGKVNLVSSAIIDPSKNSIAPGVAHLTFLDGDVDKMFVWQPKGR